MPISLNGLSPYLRKGLLPAQFSFLLLGLGLHSYRTRELFVCWLIFCFLFALLALGVLAPVLACYAGKVLLERIRGVAPVPPLPLPASKLAPTYQAPPHS